MGTDFGAEDNLIPQLTLPGETGMASAVAVATSRGVQPVFLKKTED